MRIQVIANLKMVWLKATNIGASSFNGLKKSC